MRLEEYVHHEIDASFRIRPACNNVPPIFWEKEHISWLKNDTKRQGLECTRILNLKLFGIHTQIDLTETICEGRAVNILSLIK